MYKQLTALALCTAAACFSMGAHAEIHDVTGWFINGGIGSAHYNAGVGDVSGSESATGFRISEGWRSKFIGVVGGYTNLGHVTERDGFGDSARASARGWTLGLDTHINPVGKWYVSARAGFFFWKASLRANLADGAGGADRLSAHTHGTNGYAGVGTGIDFNRHWSLGVNYDYYQMKKYGAHINTDLYSVTMGYRF